LPILPILEANLCRLHFGSSHGASIFLTGWRGKTVGMESHRTLSTSAEIKRAQGRTKLEES